MNWIKLQKTLAIITLGGMPFATVSSCDYGPGGGGDFYLDRNVDRVYSPGYGYDDPYEYDVIIEETYYEEDVYYDDYYWEDEYYYEDYYYEDDFLFDVFGWF